MSKIIELVASNIVSGYRQKQKVVNLIADAVTQAVQENQSQADINNPEKIPYYINRALKEIRQRIDDANFELGDILEEDNSVIKNIFFNEEGGATVIVTKSFSVASDVNTGEEYEKIRKEFNKPVLRPDLAKFASYTLSTPTIENPNMTLTIRIILPPSMLETLGATNFNKRTQIIQKYVVNLLKEELDD